MSLYKIIRYFFFLVFVMITVCYFLPRNYMPWLSGFYTSLENTYNSIPEYFNMGKPDTGYFVIDDTKNNLLLPIERDVQNFFNDISSEFAIDSAIDRRFDDLNYLIQTYLIQNKFFEDVVLYYDDKMIYKKNQQISKNPIVLQYQQKTRRGMIVIDFIFNNMLLQDYVKNSDSPHTILYYRSKYFQSSENIKLTKKLIQYQQKTNGQYDFSSRYYLHKKLIDHNLIFPITVYYLEEKKASVAGFFQFLFLMLFPIFWGGIMVIDKSIVYGIQQHKIRQNQKEFLAQNNLMDIDEDDSLDWLDEFVREEEKSSK